MKRFVLLVLAALLPVAALAHDPGLGTAEVTVAPGKVTLQLGYAPKDLAALGWPAVAGGAEPGHSKGARPLRSLEALAPKLWRITRGGKELPLLSRRAWLESGNSVRIDLGYADQGTGPLQLEDRAMASLPAGHRDYLSITRAGTIALEQLIDAKTGPVQLAQAAAVSPPPAPGWAFLRLGVMHIWTGYDHLLFLFGLLVVCRSFRSIAGIISCFTLAHSITLALSTLNVVTIPSRIIEPAIAASIVFVGIENLVRRGAEPKARWVLTFLFGLIHGFGFASALKELGVGSDGRSIALPLFTFNFGVELGQIAIAAAVLPLVWQLRQRPAFVLRGVPILSSVVALMGLVWLLQRTLLA